MPRFTFENKVTLSGVIQIVLLLLAAAGAYYGILGRVEGNDRDIAGLQRAVSPIESLNVRLTVVESRAEAADRRVDDLVSAIDKLVDQINSDRLSSTQVKTDVGYLRDWVEEQKRAAK